MTIFLIIIAIVSILIIRYILKKYLGLILIFFLLYCLYTEYPNLLIDLKHLFFNFF